ncbi:unnamed protein product [Prorocentrum cordatum]|uniref:RNA helicase n=1 Tax=Prorocentrum cordatum TaxID=2364126 RepID=A0ABN9TBG1_9DINO|nr:unnamed protein product [Polarella glacialis]
MPRPAGPTSAALDPHQFATLGGEAELRDAVSGWLCKLREFFGPKQGDGRARLTALFASCCHSEVDLHNAAMAMGVQNRGQGKVVTHATRPLFEAHIEELLLFFGPVTEIRGPEPKAAAPGLLSAPVQRFSARELLRQPRSASGDGS